jgi:TfoX/Sxy family transcriptional regulator of competence genes
MAYDEKLAMRVRRLLSDRTDVAERAMFGGLTFMVAGHMCCGVNGNELILRLHPDDVAAALTRPHARATDFTGRTMRGFVTVASEGLSGQALGRWVAIAVAQAESRPARRAERTIHSKKSRVSI